MRLRAFLAGLLLAGQAHAQIVVRHPAFAVVQSTAPALDLNFLTTTLDSRVTFSRASTRSCTNSSGQIVSVAVNVACMDYDPTVGANLLSNTTDAGAVVGIVGGTGSLPTGWVVNAADGLTTTVVSLAPLTLRFSGTPTGSFYMLYLQSAVSVTQNVPYLASANIATTAGTLTNISVAQWQITGNYGSNGVQINATSTPTYQPVGYNSLATINRPAIYLGTTSGQAVDITISISGSYFGLGPALKGLSVEAGATNSLLYSASIQTTANWTASTLTVTGNAAMAPDGTTTAAGLALTGNGGYVGQNQPLANSTTVTLSAFIKPNATNWVELIAADFGGSGVYVWFNASTCATGANSPYGTSPPTFVSATAQVWPNGWCRASVTATSSTGGTGNLGLLLEPTAANSAQGLTGNSAYAWGATRELGYAPTSYIPTTSAAVTRAADVAYVNVVGLQGINGNTGSLFGQMVYEAPAPTANYTRWLAFNDGNNPNAGTEWGFDNTFASSGAATVTGAVASNAVAFSYYSVSPTWAIGTLGLFAMRFNPNTASVAFQTGGTTNGVLAAMSPTYISRTLTVLNFNGTQRYQNPAGGVWFQRVTYYPTDLGAAWAMNKASGAIP